VSDTTTPTSTRSGAAVAHRAVVIALPVIVLVQASLAGQHLFEGSSISLHGILGEVAFALTVVGLVLTIVRRSEGPEFFLAVALMALSFAQVGLGFVGRDTSAAAAWHIPLGVTIFGLACYQLAALRRP
jgi:glucose uptake protein GlcU